MNRPEKSNDTSTLRRLAATSGILEKPAKDSERNTDHTKNTDHEGHGHPMEDLSQL